MLGRVRDWFSERRAERNRTAFKTAFKAEMVVEAIDAWEVTTLKPQLARALAVLRARLDNLDLSGIDDSRETLTAELRANHNQYGDRRAHLFQEAVAELEIYLMIARPEGAEEDVQRAIMAKILFAEQKFMERGQGEVEEVLRR